MSEPASPESWRAMGAANAALGLALIPCSVFLGSFFFIALGVWLILIGVKLFWQRPDAAAEAAAAHKFLSILAVLASLYGAWALHAGRQSALRGGGIMSAFGLMPLAGGVMMLVFAFFNLRWARRVGGSSPSP